MGMMIANVLILRDNAYERTTVVFCIIFFFSQKRFENEYCCKKAKRKQNHQFDAISYIKSSKVHI